MQFYRYLIIKNLKLINMLEYDEYKYGLFHQDRKLLKKRCTIFFKVDWLLLFYSRV